MGVATTLCNPPPAQESRRRRSANKEARRHRDNSNAAPITNVFCCYTANFLFVWCCCLCRSRDAQPCGCSPPGTPWPQPPPPTAPYRRFCPRHIFLFTFSLFSSLLASLFFLSALSPVFFSLSPAQRSVNILKRGVAVGGSGDEEDLRNADTAFPRLSGPLPFGASSFSRSTSRRLARGGQPCEHPLHSSLLFFVHRLDANSRASRVVS